MDHVSWFERWWLSAWPHRLHIHRKVPAFLKASPEPFRGEVLEIGAGPGWTSRRMLDTYPQIELTVVDSSPKVVQHLQQLGRRYGQRLNVQEGRVEQLPFDRDRFDIVVAMHLLHHVDDVAQALIEMMRVVRSGGLIGIVDENQHYVVGPLRWLFPSRSKLDRNEIVRLLEKEGADVKVSEGGAHFIVWAQQPYPHTP